MQQLQGNWLTEGLIDAEYKKYLLLGWLQRVKGHFDETRLYPWLAELHQHFQNLQLIRDNKQMMTEKFPKNLTHADFEKLKLVYEEVIKDDVVMKELEEIIHFSLPLLQAHLEKGKGLYEEVEQQLILEPVGVTPLHLGSGYLMIRNGDKNDTLIYQYESTLFEQANEKYRGINTQLVDQFTSGITHTFEAIKVSLIKRYQHLPNPATWVVYSKKSWPYDETLLPIARRLLMRQLAA